MAQSLNMLSAIIFIYKNNNEPVPNWVGFVFIGMCLIFALIAFLSGRKK